MKKNRTLALTLFALISCGGGGGGGSNNAPVISQTPTPPTTPPSLSYDELKDQYEGYYEYQSQWGLNMVNASSAYARGATGAGITIGITDSGLDNTHVEISATRLSGDSALSYSNYTPNTRQTRHGTMVASVAAGKQDKTDITPMHGVAFEADVLFVAIQLAEPDPDYDPVDIGDDDGSGNVSGAPDFTGIDNFFSQLFEIYNDYDVDIVNNSYGYSGNINDYTEAQVRYAFPNTIAEMSQVGTPDSEKTIYVWAAGNAGGYADQGVDYSSPELLPGMAHYIPEIQGHSIAVVSVDENGQISDFSSRCGVAQEYCIAAPGGKVTAAYPTFII
jgi:subtilase-type serine protease